AYSASAKDSCFIGKLGQGSGCISPESGSLFQDFPSLDFLAGRAYANLPVRKPLQHKRKTSTCLRQACRLKSTATLILPTILGEEIKKAIHARPRQ
ncbi:hypothetical protein, partial [Azotobacter salinestris]